jgi:hypothetical protein
MAGIKEIPRTRFGFKVSGLGVVDYCFEPEAYLWLLEKLSDDYWGQHFSHMQDCIGCRHISEVFEMEEHDFRITKDLLVAIVEISIFDSQLGDLSMPSRVQKALVAESSENCQSDFGLKFLEREITRRSRSDQTDTTEGSNP